MINSDINNLIKYLKHKRSIEDCTMSDLGYLLGRENYNYLQWDQGKNKFMMNTISDFCVYFGGNPYMKITKLEYFKHK